MTLKGIERPRHFLIVGFQVQKGFMDAFHPHPAKTGAIYFALIFGLGFALGTIRVMWLVPMTGETIAVLAEQPVMLTASWFAARWLVRRHRLFTVRARRVMGLTAFTLLMLAEVALASALLGQAPVDWLKSIFAMPGIIGLTGQILFALMPLMVRVDRASNPRSPSQ